MLLGSEWLLLGESFHGQRENSWVPAGYWKDTDGVLGAPETQSLSFLKARSCEEIRQSVPIATY